MAMFRYPREVGSRSPTVDKSDKKEGDGLISCDICFDGWDSETEVEIHRTSAHKNELLHIMRDKNQYVCRICIKPHENMEELVRHVKTWHLLSNEDATRVEREIFICNICSVIFFNKLLIQAHIMVFHMNMDKLNTFTECPKCFKLHRLKTIWYHFQGHHIQSVSCCKICLTKCKTKDEVLEHVKGHKKYLFCNICQYESKNETYFKEHLSSRHSPPKQVQQNSNLRWKPYFMPRIGDYRMKFLFDTPFKGVALSYLDEYKIRICILCREICVGEQSMRDHIQNNHVQVKSPQLSHVCSCGESFNNKVLLKHHIFKLKGEHSEADPATQNNDHVQTYTVVLVDGDEAEKTI